VHARQYHETLFSQLYPGKQQSTPTYVPMLEALDRTLALSEAQKARTILRTDAGFGSDANVNSALENHWQIVRKSSGGRRPAALARQVAETDWQVLGPTERWLATVAPAVAFVRPVQWLLLGWCTARGDLKQAVVLCSIEAWSPAEVIGHYDARGACETEIQADKGGLLLCRRRKKVLAAQEALVLLTDMAHNLLAWAGRWMALEGRLATFGPTQLIQDVLPLPGHLVFNQQQLVEVRLNAHPPYAAEVAAGLDCLLAHFGYP
jgi:Transposase DDE domain group 1